VKGGFDRRKSLQELEQDDWGEPTHNSYLVMTIHRLRRKPLADFTVEDFRLVLGQRIALPFLIPLAVERLEDHPLAAGDLYPGDLLQAVVRAGDEFWSGHTDCLQRVRKIVRQVKDLLPSLDEMVRQSVLHVLDDAQRSLAK
jgi:hypothetical protein